MKYASLGLASALLLAGSPAFATQGLECRSPGRRGFELYLSIGSGGGVDLVSIVGGGQELRATGLPGANPRLVRETYMDRVGRVRIRIVSGNGRTVIARLALRNSSAGVLLYRGRTLRISCRWESQE
jgi:hypothetical protein